MREYKYPSPVIAERIQEILFELELTDKYVAEQLNMERKVIFNYRHAITNPSIKFIRWLCQTYKVDARWLLDLKGEQEIG